MFLIDSDGVLMKPRVHGNTGRQIEIAKVNTLIVDVLMVVTGRWGGQGKKGSEFGTARISWDILVSQNFKRGLIKDLPELLRLGSP